MKASIKTIEIQTRPFFERLKETDVDMWQILRQMIKKDEEQLVIFLDEQGKELAHYMLPTSEEQLEEDRKLFAEAFKLKLEV